MEITSLITQQKESQGAASGKTSDTAGNTAKAKNNGYRGDNGFSDNCEVKTPSKKQRTVILPAPQTPALPAV